MKVTLVDQPAGTVDDDESKDDPAHISVDCHADLGWSSFYMIDASLVLKLIAGLSAWQSRLEEKETQREKSVAGRSKTLIVRLGGHMIVCSSLDLIMDEYEDVQCQAGASLQHSQRIRCGSPKLMVLPHYHHSDKYLSSCALLRPLQYCTSPPRPAITDRSPPNAESIFYPQSRFSTYGSAGTDVAGARAAAGRRGSDVGAEAGRVPRRTVAVAVRGPASDQRRNGEAQGKDWSARGSRYRVS